MEREKCYYKWFSKYFGKINRNVENKSSVDYSMISEETVFLQKQPPEVFCKKDVFRNFTKFTGKHLCQSHFFNKVAGILKKRLWHRCFPVNFAKFLRTLFSHPLSDCFYS